MAIVSGKKWVSAWGALPHVSPLGIAGAQRGINQNTCPWQPEVKPMNLSLDPLAFCSFVRQNLVFIPPKCCEGLILLILRGWPQHTRGTSQGLSQWGRAGSPSCSEMSWSQGLFIKWGSPAGAWSESEGFKQCPPEPRVKLVGREEGGRNSCASPEYASRPPSIYPGC